MGTCKFPELNVTATIKVRFVLVCACYFVDRVISLHATMHSNISTVYRSNMSPGRLTKSLRVGAYSFRYFLQGSIQKRHKYTSIPSWSMEMGIWSIILCLWLIISKFDRWALIGAWAAIGTNTVFDH